MYESPTAADRTPAVTKAIENTPGVLITVVGLAPSSDDPQVQEWKLDGS